MIITVPPLSKRRNDISFLVNNILSKLSVKFNKKLSGVTEDFMDLLKKNYWTGNVRELEQVITRQALVEETPILTGKSFMLSTESSYSKEVVTDNFQLVQQALVDAGLIKQKLLQH